jgi:tRNA-uridine 2-sulfurtransferase
MKQKKKKVFVGMSGGVDSSVAAALLTRAGFDVVGIYMKCWTQGALCTTKEDERSARLAASHLAIPLYVLNFIEEYKQKVVEYMLKGYQQGITPNPDIMCNREIKFGLFFNKAMQLGADFVATGHYARIKKTNTGCALLKGKDQEKDQSYFLAMVEPETLRRVLFPIGDYQKSQVRAYAKKIGLPNAQRKDSQGICFVGKVQIGDFLRLHLPQKVGSIVLSDGKVLGEHDGAHYFTIGQRQGLGLSGGPYYVAKKDIVANTLVVSKEEQDVLTSEVLVQGINWLVPFEKGMEGISAKFRYRQKDVSVLIEQKGKDCVLAKPSVPQRAITPGQFAVFYRGDQLLGGGVIV